MRDHRVRSVLGHHRVAVAICGAADDCAIERSPNHGPDDRTFVGCAVVRGSVGLRFRVRRAIRIRV